MHRTNNSEGHSLGQEKAQKLLQYSLPEQTDKDLQHSKHPKIKVQSKRQNDSARN